MKLGGAPALHSFSTTRCNARRPPFLRSARSVQFVGAPSRSRNKRPVACAPSLVGLHYDLQAAGSKLKAALLVPGATATNILYADRNRPEALKVPVDQTARATLTERRRIRHERVQQTGMKPEEVGAIVVQAIKDGRFYILADPERTKRFVRLRREDILNETGPSPEAGV